MRLEELLENVFHVEFRTQYELNSTFLRIEGHSSHPEFKGRIFRLNEFREWYIQNTSTGKKTGKFYLLPDDLEPFYEGKFDPLYKGEKELLEEFKERRGIKWHMIATFRGRRQNNILRHELGHFLFETNPSYKEEVMKVLSEMKTRDRIRITNYLVREGYQYNDVDDETHAVLCGEKDYFKDSSVKVTKGIDETQKKIEEILRRHLPEELKQKLKLV